MTTMPSAPLTNCGLIKVIRKIAARDYRLNGPVELFVRETLSGKFVNYFDLKRRDCKMISLMNNARVIGRTKIESGAKNSPRDEKKSQRILPC
jgi:hypothetical protein